MSAFSSRVEVSFDQVSWLVQLKNACQFTCNIYVFFNNLRLVMKIYYFFRYSHSGRSNDVDQTSHMLTIATRDLFGELDKSVKAVAPMQFWMVCYLYSLFKLISLTTFYFSMKHRKLL